MTIEKWRRIYPPNFDASHCFFVSLTFDEAALAITIENRLERRLLISAEMVIAHRCVSESFVIDLSCIEISEPGGSIVEIDDSSFLAQVHSASFGIYRDTAVKVFAVITQSFVIEIITEAELKMEPLPSAGPSHA